MFREGLKCRALYTPKNYTMPDQFTHLFKSCYFEEAILIRKVEEFLLSLFGKGLLNGTVHTCIGQEFSALAFGKQLTPDDFIFSNHRCHGHYIAFIGEYYRLVAEMMGKKCGVSGGIGGSQHLCARNFYSNGVQGGIVPVAAGMALANKLKGNTNVGAVFIGDGTLGEGVLYETLNIIAKWEIPLLVILENNLYAQSTSQQDTLAGDVLARPAAFGIKTYQSTTRALGELFQNAKSSIDYVRHNSKPAFHLVDTYRLAPHSKGDDFRDAQEIEKFRVVDPIVVFSVEQPQRYAKLVEELDTRLQDTFKALEQEEAQNLEEYLKGTDAESVRSGPTEWIVVPNFPGNGSEGLMIHHLNQAFHSLMEEHKNILFIGEDILSPYGGAFKAARDLSTAFPDRVLTTPISEAAIIGIGNGLALRGMRPFVEIMFGDFITLGLDQLINHASKFHAMYNKQVNCPVVVRTPMGGRRGYGPTHSQTLDKLLIGIDNLKVFALNQFLNPIEVYQQVCLEKQPVVVIENKLDYAKKFNQVKGGVLQRFYLEKSNTPYPMLRIRPRFQAADLSIVAYGGTVDVVLQSVEALFSEEEILAEVLICTQISPVPVGVLTDGLGTSKVLVVEEGTSKAGFCSEIMVCLIESGYPIQKLRRVTSLATAIPSSNELEKLVLVNSERIVATAVEMINGHN